ncbi:excinuclease ABC subunit A [Spiroplasma mirum ATCC 29335]|uniref:UvrABC system protein A n=1 Tax=Spiroplasma mirum ATCC 29335 TaxID=838561 RepID=W0GMH9_9MOLU|nr:MULTISPECIES: excinuclease ABC subunit UvrA [Spiroplasma]AHF61387.1 excinuclease ABC subunit A [Spiroplasma mirum ATCC 29335]AHI58514.1 excinuclease ABC subunit A [Spiroplasma mirum ATCC 29335]AKM53438.1 excinuclease ABC subunit A [Spiroplasma atrichopogonis]
MSKDKIIVKGARENNLKNINVEIPKNKLVVFTGLSGSGKSSLAFNTIYAEGRRRYIESLSSYARQFLGGNEKPDVDAIEGLSPAISIDQKTTSHNPRSTVGTVTEIYDYLRLLYARVGTPYCINGHGIIKSVTIKEIINNLKQQVKADDKLMILSPIVRDKKGSFKDLFLRLKQESFLRVKVNDEIKSLDDEIELDKNKRQNIDIVIDRIVFRDNEDMISRIHDAIEIALKYGDSLVKIYLLDQNKELLFSTNYSCSICGFVIPELEPRLFSFNSPTGACYECKGLGVKLEVDEELLIPNRRLTILQGGIVYLKNIVNTTNLEWQKFKVLANHYNIPLDQPIENLPREQLQYLIRGSDEPIEYNIRTASGNTMRGYDYIEGIGQLIERRYTETTSESAREYYKQFMADKKCTTCQGKRLNKLPLAVKINNLNIADFTDLSVEDELQFVLNVSLTETQQEIARLIINELVNRLDFLNRVGLSYLTLSRNAQTLSGGEAQRIRLATQIGSQLTGVLYVLDEPSIGLHQRDNDMLIDTLKSLRDLGNTLIVVEHDEDTIMASDYIVDIGPAAGINGGEVVAIGTVDDIMANPESITGKYLKGEETIEVPKTRRGGNGLTLEIKGARENNLKNINVTIPLNKFICLTGVSGSGKSTLMNEILWKGIKKNLGNLTERPGAHNKIVGIDNIDKVINISQDPIGKTPRSNPATYTSVFDDIRDLFAGTPEAKARGYLKGRFSFNVPGGRCENCQGDGIIKISMHFLPTVFVQCEVCEGKRYNDETLMVKYKEKNIYDVLEMTVDQACAFFEKQPKIKQKLTTMQEVGLGYIKLGQSATELSGGEAQRVKLSTFLLKRATGKTLFLLDEPTTGLHIDDVKRLLKVLNRIVDNGDTVVTIEHNLDVIKVADYIIDLGPNGGVGGGKIVATGTPEQVAKKTDASYTAKYLKKMLEK